MSRASRRTVRIPVAICAAISFGACSDTPKPPKAATTSSAVLEGSVVLADGANTPSYSAQQLVREVLRPAPLPEEADRADGAKVPADSCQRTTGRPEALRLSKERGLQGVVVALSGFQGDETGAVRTHAVTLGECGLEPTSIAAAKGDLLRVTNRSGHPQQLTFGPAVEAHQLAADGTLDIELPDVGVESVICSAETCGRVDVVVLHHRYAAVTGEDGRFRIGDAPAGQLVQLHAWHPLLSEAKASAYVPRQGAKRLRMTVRPQLP